jgi:serine phosphatase RsbU (regulator of sigma subunit)
MSRLISFVVLFFFVLYGFSVNDSLYQKLRNATQSQRSLLYNNISVAYQNTNLDSSIHYAALAINNAKKFGQARELSRGYGLLGKVYVFKGELDFAEKYLDSSILIAKGFYPDSYVNALINKGLVLESRGLFSHALEIYHNCLEIADSLKLKNVKAQALNNLGIVYKSLEKFDEALLYYNEALAMKKEQKDIDGIAFILNNIGTVYDILGNTKKALEVYNEAYKLNKAEGNTLAVAYTEHNLAMIYKSMGEYDKALKKFESSLDVAMRTNDVLSIAYNYHQLGDLLYKTNKLVESERYIDKSLEIAKNAELSSAKVQNYYLKSLIAEKYGKYKASLNYYKLYAELRDSLFSTENRKRVEELRMAYEKSRIEKRVELLEREKKLQGLKLEQNEVQIRIRNLWIVIFIVGFVIIVLFLIVLVRQIKQKRKANELLAHRNIEITKQNEEIKTQSNSLKELNQTLENQNAEIEAQNDALAEQTNLVTRQRDKILHQKQNLTDNISYAARIQKALLPPKSLFSEYFADYFILNQPQGIVGGDFYWIGKVDTKIVLVTADCTGHGVTGGFMSVLGASILNEIVLGHQITNPGAILNRTRDQIISSLHQSHLKGNNSDGMDVTVFCFDKENQTYEFAAANQKAYMINGDDNKIVELNGDKMPVAFYGDYQKDFTVQKGLFNPSDIFYLFSDGYPDQFGGKSNRKFMYKRFRNLIEKAAPLTMNEQLDLFATTFYQWKGHNDQVDDVLVLGIIV